MPGKYNVGVSHEQNKYLHQNFAMGCGTKVRGKKWTVSSGRRVSPPIDFSFPDSDIEPRRALENNSHIFDSSSS